MEAKGQGCAGKMEAVRPSDNMREATIVYKSADHPTSAMLTQTINSFSLQEDDKEETVTGIQGYFVQKRTTGKKFPFPG